MSFIVKAPEQKVFKMLEAWSYPARCISIIDLWTQIIEWQGEAKELRKVRFTWEFPSELEIFSEEKWEQPFILSKEFTLSLHEKWKLRPFLEGWRGKKFTQEELEWFELEDILWAVCLLSVVHLEYNGKTYANIENASLLPKGLTCWKPINPQTIFNMCEFNQEIFDSFSQFIRFKIMDSTEYKIKFDTMQPE